MGVWKTTEILLIFVNTTNICHQIAVSKYSIKCFSLKIKFQVFLQQIGKKQQNLFKMAANTRQGSIQCSRNLKQLLVKLASKWLSYSVQQLNKQLWVFEAKKMSSNNKELTKSKSAPRDIGLLGGDQLDAQSGTDQMCGSNPHPNHDSDIFSFLRHCITPYSHICNLKII